MAEFKKKSYNDEDRKKWGKVFTSEYMSSDESGIEDGKGLIFVKDLPWRHKRVANFFQKLKDEHNSKKSEQANRQIKERVKKEEKVFTRAAPADAPTWALSKK